MLSFWLPVLLESLTEVVDTLSRRKNLDSLNGKRTILAQVSLLAKELLEQVERLERNTQ